MTTHLSDTALQIISIGSIIVAVGLAFYSINSALNHLHHRVDEIERVLHKNLRKHK
jgi:hypothetical protein